LGPTIVVPWGPLRAADAEPEKANNFAYLKTTGGGDTFFGPISESSLHVGPGGDMTTSSSICPLRPISDFFGRLLPDGNTDPSFFDASVTYQPFLEKFRFNLLLNFYHGCVAGTTFLLDFVIQMAESLENAENSIALSPFSIESVTFDGVEDFQPLIQKKTSPRDFLALVPTKGPKYRELLFGPSSFGFSSWLKARKETITIEVLLRFDHSFNVIAKSLLPAFELPGNILLSAVLRAQSTHGVPAPLFMAKYRSRTAQSAAAAGSSRRVGFPTKHP
jgi:hypothetical protein